jgi:hypothetical protein
LRLPLLAVLAVAKLLDKTAANAWFPFAGRRRKDAGEVEMGALRAGLTAVAADFADAAAIAGACDSASHGH